MYLYLQITESFEYFIKILVLIAMSYSEDKMNLCIYAVLPEPLLHTHTHTHAHTHTQSTVNSEIFLRILFSQKVLKDIFATLKNHH